MRTDSAASSTADGTPASPLELFEGWQARRWAGAESRAIVAGDWGVVGFVIWEEQPPDGAPSGPARVIHALAMRQDARNFGYGAEVIELLETATPRATMYAPIPRGNGLAVYFWLHAGFRPVRLDESVTLATDAARLWCLRAPGRPPA